MDERRSPLHDLHAAASASFGDWQGWRLPAGYGPDAAETTAAEYASAREGAALVDLAERGVLEVSGPQRQKFLEGMLSNDVASRQPGQGCLAALMTAKGHIQALMRVLVAPDTVLLEMPADRLSVVEETLVHYKVAAPVRFKPRPTAVLGLVGPGAPSVLLGLGAELPELPAEGHARVAVGKETVLLARATDLPPAGFVLHVAPESAAATWTALRDGGARPLGRRALDALRVEAGRPWYGPDVGEANLLHETGLVSETHSFTKGCYIGQEVIARLDARGGNVSRALRGLRLDAPVASGSQVTAAGKDVGRVTTTAVSPRLGPVALAYIHRTHFAPDTAVEVEGASARVVALPFDR
jgi:folate-binding protein YgfZ